MNIPPHVKKKLDDCVNELAHLLPADVLIGGLLAHAVRLVKEQNESISSLHAVIERIERMDTPSLGVN